MPSGTMTSKGQITVPKAVRDDLGLVTGSQVAFTRTPDGDYLLRRESQSIRSLRGSLRYDGPPVTFEAMNEAIVEASR
ncbi:MAG: AbrB/MazE/SpoVT family DNA-binding domain-containing protein [Frankiaceae bacterium]|jgi:AbrB family looped-hinge helix DNA binding protein|nr:AbrB/MazE/SpoVT family DNA-binding domain-containing protein [Frankiaceae bacterium]